MKTLIIIPAYNEQQSITSVIKEISEKCPECDYVVINDCSTDKTSEILDTESINHIDLCLNLGIGGGVQTGYRYALINGYECAVQIDGDGQHNPEYIKNLTEIIKNGEADVVIGSRFINKDGFQSSGMRRFGIKFLSMLIKAVCKADIKDVTSGFRAVNRKFIEFYSENYADDYPEPEAIVTAALKGAKVLEYPVIMRERNGGVSSISHFKSVYYMVKVSLAIIFARFIMGGEVK